MRTALVLLLVCTGIARAAEGDDPNPEIRRLGEQATSLHREALQTNDTAKYERAATYYQEYLAKSHAHEEAMTFYYAELLFKLQRYDEAARQYEHVLAIAPKGKFAEEAAYADVIATKNAVKSDDQPDHKPPCPDMKPCAIPPDVLRLVAALDRYLTVTNKERPTMEYRRARIYYDYQHFGEAAPLFDHIFASFPDHELATYSANLEMDCLAIGKRYDKLRGLVERVKKSPTMKDETVRQQVQTIDAGLKKHGK